MDYEAFVRKEDLFENPAQRVPICLCLDTSGSMNIIEGGTYHATGETIYRDGHTFSVATGGKTRLMELQKGIELFYESVSSDVNARDSAELSIVTFDDTAKCLTEFSNINPHMEVPQLTTGDNTCLGEGVLLALDNLEARKKEYQNAGVDYYQPWLVLMTDGAPNGSNPQKLKEAMRRASCMVNNSNFAHPKQACNNAQQGNVTP